MLLLLLAIQRLDLRQRERLAVLKVGGERVEAVVAVGDGGHGVLVLRGVVFCGDGRWEVGFIGYRRGMLTPLPGIW